MTPDLSTLLIGQTFGWGWAHPLNAMTMTDTWKIQNAHDVTLKRQHWHELKCKCKPRKKEIFTSLATFCTFIQRMERNKHWTELCTIASLLCTTADWNASLSSFFFLIEKNKKTTYIYCFLTQPRVCHLFFWSYYLTEPLLHEHIFSSRATDFCFC